MTAITDQAFSAAQEEELSNWVGHTGNSSRLLYELAEHSDIARPLARYLPETAERALEVGVGCFGLGFLAVHLWQSLERLDGIDPLPRLPIAVADPALQQYLDEIRSRVNYIQTQGERLPFEDATYDLCACINVVDHAQSPEAILREIHRVLKPGGVFAFSVSTLSWAGEWKWAFNRWRRPNEFLFVAHPHTYQWTRADALIRSLFPQVLWHDRPRLKHRLIGRGRMSSWIVKKS